ncbi:sulfite exporter TauE/SafE family protein [Flavobacterium sp. ASW18X]|uniref:sulfite exporter TauE/SafE family protein n=1 Tax=Flavobacterium sp. ASW18X TaxID=2572595 RepID=UPI0010ADA7FF|nr:sulfite exporter TauE/SafE family protein [Flavobacterium sp. ASW18X]TKD59154.1 sulfite exporter TauE/SafE family protein [Flavobacterium sp. ASW18X]
MLTAALVLGILGSLHCLGMCGPIAFMLPLDREHKGKKLMQLFLYHLGRVLAYGILGLVFGVVGKGLYLFGIQQKLSIVIGILMIAITVIPAKYLNTLKLTAPIYKIIGQVKTALGSALKKRTADTFLTIGFLNGFLPCGLVYMALLGAIALATPMQGALYMMLFGVGTIPLMTSAVFFSSLLQGNTKQRLQKWIPAFVVLIGVLFVLRGMGLGIPYVSPKAPAPQTEMVSGQMECH